MTGLVGRSGALGSEFIAESFGFGFQAVDAPLQRALFVGLSSFIHVGLTPAQKPVNEGSDFSGGSKDRYVGSQPLGKVTIVRP